MKAKKRARLRVAITFSQPSLTQQHSKDEVDINNIMARYVRTGVLDHVQKYQPQYTENTGMDYHTSMNMIRKADEMFLDLPSQAREQFGNDPAKFMDFVHNPENHGQLAEMGLTQNQMSPPSDNPPPPPAKPAEQKKPTSEPAPASNAE